MFDIKQLRGAQFVCGGGRYLPLHVYLRAFGQAADPKQGNRVPYLGPKYVIFWVTMDFVIQHCNKSFQHFPRVQNFNTVLLGEMDLKEYGLF